LADDLAAKGAQLIGIDMDVKRIEIAKKRYSRPNLSFLNGDILKIDLNRRFDIIVMSNVLEHINEREKLLRDLEARYRPRCFLIRVPMLDRHWSVSMRAELGLPRFIDPTHCTEYTVESFCAEIEDAGLKVAQLSVCWGEIWSEVACIPSDA
jgi:2-polyprenyl-3-methyl-5-hydroxy-6-metoxy-1,4-benzoquinol methylase